MAGLSIPEPIFSSAKWRKRISIMAFSGWKPLQGFMVALPRT